MVNEPRCRHDPLEAKVADIVDGWLVKPVGRESQQVPGRDMDLYVFVHCREDNVTKTLRITRGRRGSLGR